METEWCKTGDIVSLKSRGPRMTVVFVESGGFNGTTVMCQWFNRAGDLKAGSFPADSLAAVLEIEEKEDE